MFMQGAVRIPLIILGAIIVVIVSMAALNLCPPSGPWSMPPWCGGVKEVEVDKGVIQQKSEGLGLESKVAFIVTVPGVTPEEDDIYIQGTRTGINIDFNTKMTMVNRTTWKAEILLPPGKEVNYGYTRNNVGYETSEEVTPGDTQEDWFKKRSVKWMPPAKLVQKDEIKKWRWLLNEPPEVELLHDTKEFQPRVQGWEHQEGIAVIDYWWEVFFENGETEDTIKRIVEDKANYVQYSPTWGVKVTDEDIKLDRECGYCYPEKAIKYEAKTAKEAGLKVIFRNQIWIDLPPEEIKKERPAGWWAQYYKVRREYLLDMARIAQEAGVEAMSIGAAYDTLAAFTDWGSAPEESWAKWVEDIKEVKRIYKGKIYYDFNPTGSLKDSYSVDMKKFKPVLDEVDFIGISWWKGISDEDTPSLEELEKNAGNQFDQYLKPIYENTGKPLVLISIAFPSADGGSTGKYAWNSRAVDVWKPADNTYNDFQEQADVYEAVMRAVADRPWIVGTYPFGFWRHDQQDKGHNIRGKPAEEVLKKWYGAIFF